MNKPSQKYKPLDKEIKPFNPHAAASQQRQNYKKFLIFALIIVLAAIPFAMGKYYEFNTPDPFDSAANVYSAQRIIDGARIGIDEMPSADLGTLLINILGVKIFGFSEFGPKLIQGILQAAALILMFAACRRLFGTLAAAVATIVASIYISSPLIAKFGNVKEEYMIACMVIGISCFILYQLAPLDIFEIRANSNSRFYLTGRGSRWFLPVLTGAFLIWAPLFKPTGVSALGATGLFIVAQPFFKNRTWKQTFTDIALVAAGAALAIAPTYIWIIGWDVHTGLPYAFIWQTAAGIVLPAKTSGAAKGAGSYIADAWKIMPFAEFWPRLLRFCLVLILPVALAIGSIIIRLLRLFRTAPAAEPEKSQFGTADRFILLLAVWWLLDMAFVCISPRSYEQYYLPMTASGAYLGGYIIAAYYQAFSTAASKRKWVIIGAAGLVCMIIMSWRIFFGLEISPWSGLKYDKKEHGYLQSMQEISMRHRLGGMISYWEPLAEYIRLNSTPKDKIYVWGWYPGIYVQAQRFSPSAKAFESEMHIKSPQELAATIQTLMVAFEMEKPRFIVDSRKRHLPLDRFPFELWPIMPKGFMGLEKEAFLPRDKNVIFMFDKYWSDVLRRHFGEDEALRYEAMRPFREFVMNNYHIVRNFGDQVLFELNKPAESGQTPENREKQQGG